MNDSVFGDPAVSHHHALMSLQPDGWHLQHSPGGGIAYHNGYIQEDATLQTLDQLVLVTTLVRIDISAPQSKMNQPPLPLLLIDGQECHFIAPLREAELVIGSASLPSRVILRYATSEL